MLTTERYDTQREYPPRVGVAHGQSYLLWLPDWLFCTFREPHQAGGGQCGLSWKCQMIAWRLAR
jgi:hypothetical protein